MALSIFEVERVQIASAERDAVAAGGLEFVQKGARLFAIPG
jgi:hypothetical protein